MALRLGCDRRGHERIIGDMGFLATEHHAYRGVPETHTGNMHEQAAFPR
jgi:hypothetical protein